MKTTLFIILLIFLIIKWDVVTDFISGNFIAATNSAAQWMIDHTPKK